MKKQEALTNDEHSSCPASTCPVLVGTELSIGLVLVGFGSGLRLDFEKFRASIGPDAVEKLKFSMSDMLFAITDCVNMAVRNWCDCEWVKLIFLFI